MIGEMGIGEGSERGARGEREGSEGIDDEEARRWEQHRDVWTMSTR
mgnify:CR=1 FL=1